MLCASRRPTPVVIVALVVAALATLAACDTAPGAPAVLPEPPALAGFAVSPDTFFLAGGAAEAAIPLVLSGAVTSPGGGPVTVRYLARRQGDDTLAVEGAVAVAAAGAFQAADTLRLPRGASGLYLVEAVAEGADGRAGGRAAALVRFAIEPLGPPVIGEVTLTPPTVTPPATGSADVRVVATVTDPDGRANLGYVALQPAGGGPQLPLSDGGPVSQSGDATAEDGRYTVTLEIGAGAEPGQYPFEVVARDREGLVATPFPVTITVE
jgi:hypothetical protein